MRSAPSRVYAAAVLFAAAAAAVGCGGGPTLVPVRGRVLVNDQPVSGGDTVKGYVVLHPDRGKGNATRELVQGTVGEGGAFTVFTRDKEGAPPGWYKVTVDLADVKASDPYYYRPKVDDKYLEKDRSGLVVEVVENPEPGRYDLKLPARGK